MLPVPINLGIHKDAVWGLTTGDLNSTHLFSLFDSHQTTVFLKSSWQMNFLPDSLWSSLSFYQYFHLFKANIMKHPFKAESKHDASKCKCLRKPEQGKNVLTGFEVFWRLPPSKKKKKISPCATFACAEGSMRFCLSILSSAGGFLLCDLRFQFQMVIPLSCLSSPIITFLWRCVCTAGGGRWVLTPARYRRGLLRYICVCVRREGPRV